MTTVNRKNKNLLIAFCSIGLLLSVAGIFCWYNTGTRSPLHGRNAAKLTADQGEVNENSTINAENTIIVKGDIKKFPEIDYKKLDKDKQLTELMTRRKKKLGIGNSLDMVVKSDESFKVGKITISMRDILEKAFLKDKKVFEEQIKPSGETKPAKIREYGIYVVQPGDNLWDIHFRLIRGYYKSRGIKIPDKADEPVAGGLSSGMGKVLKFSEKMVVIYNILDKKIDTNINLLHPLSKIIVYNMKEVFSFLKEIGYKNLDKLRFDGESLWISAQPPLKQGK